MMDCLIVLVSLIALFTTILWVMGGLLPSEQGSNPKRMTDKERLECELALARRSNEKLRAENKELAEENVKLELEVKKTEPYR